MINTLKNTRINARILLMVLVGVIGMLALSLLLIMQQRDEMIESRIAKVRDITETGLGIVKRLETRIQKGEIDRNQATEILREAIYGMRFEGGENYIFVWTLDGTSIIHPAKPELEGKNFIGLEDKNGVPLIRNLSINSQKPGGGVTWYDWPRPGSDEAVPKLGYSIAFKPWNIYLGTGVYLDDVDAIFKSQVMSAVLVIALVLAGVIGVSVVISRSITRPMSALQKAMDKIAHGDTDVDVDFINDRSEIGDFARALDIFKAQAEETNTLRAEQQKAEARLAEERRRATLELADAFNTKVGSAISSVSQSASEFKTSAQSMSETAEETSREADAVARASEQATSNVQTVAAASEQLAASITEISRQVAHSAQTCENAVVEAKRSTEMVGGLSEAAQKVGDVVALINDIAEQTNLLALNATIEAARAGEAGKGFAVVASEVKNLATQTARATGEIETQIKGIQEATTGAVTAIGDIAQTIEELNATSSAIAAAVEQQGAATREISANVERTAAGTQQVSDNITRVSTGSDKTSEASGRLLEAASGLSSQAEFLSREVGNFLTEIRKD